MRIFISYGWENKASRELLVKKILEARHEAVWDQDYISWGDEIFRAVVEQIRTADAMVVHLTRDSVASEGVTEELVRAHHQNLRIYPIVQKDVVHQMPWFLRTREFQSYEYVDDLDRVFNVLIEKLARDEQRLLRWKTQKALQDLTGSVDHFLVHDELVYSPEKWKYEYIEAVLRNAGNELSSLKNSHVRSIVGDASNYLIRATPVFENANQVYAVSLDTVSTFWTSPKRPAQQLAKDYLHTQPEHTQRLFVFSDPYKAHDYSTILNIHAKKYDPTADSPGRVYLCSIDAYRNLVARWADFGPSSDPFESDFAILTYGTGRKQSTYLATLNELYFRVELTSRNTFPRVQEDVIQSVFSDWQYLRPGEIDGDYGVMRWQIDLQKEKSLWAEKLSQLFGDHKPDIVHLVFFTERALQSHGAKGRLMDLVQTIRDTLENFERMPHHGILPKDVWFGEYKHLPAIARRYRGRIHNEEASRFPYLLMTRFQNPDSLSRWYEIDDHTDIRQQIFELFDPKFAELFNTLETIRRQNPYDVEVGATYEQIEAEALDYMARRDYHGAETIADIVKRKEYKPQIKF